MHKQMINQRARAAMKGNYGMAIVIVFLIQLIQGVISNVVRVPFAFGSMLNMVTWSGNLPQDLRFDVLWDLVDTYAVSTVGFISILVSMVASAILGVYQSYAFQGPIQGRKLTMDEGFRGLREAGYGRGLATSLWSALFQALWSLLFVIPGIIKSYGYSQAIYLVRDRQDLKPRQALKESEQLMRGRKMQLFRLQLRYLILPFLLALLMVVLVFLMFIAFATDSGITGLLLLLALLGLLFLLIIVSYYVTIMLAAVNASFYETLYEALGQQYRGTQTRQDDAYTRGYDGRYDDRYRD